MAHVGVNNIISINQYSDIDLIIFSHSNSLEFKAVGFHQLCIIIRDNCPVLIILISP